MALPNIERPEDMAAKKPEFSFFLGLLISKFSVSTLTADEDRINQKESQGCLRIITKDDDDED